MKGKPVMGTFMTYQLNANGQKGEIVEVDFKVKGKEIEYKYTKLKSRVS